MDPHAAPEHAAPAEAVDADVAAHADRTPVKMKVGIRLTGLSKLELGPGSYNAELVVTVRCEREPCKPEIETPNGKITGREVVHAEKLVKVFKIKAELTGFVDLSEFPYDKHVLPIVLEDKGDPEDVVYELDTAHTSIQDDVKLPGWSLVKWAADVEKEDVGEGISVSQIHFGVLVERPGLSATFKTIVPVAFMIFVAGFTLLLKPKSAAGRLSAATGGLMTIVMFHISATSSLPPLTYLTRMDKFMLATYVVYLVNIAFAVAIVRADEQKDEKRAERLYLTAAGAIPGLALVAWLGVFLKLA